MHRENVCLWKTSEPGVVGFVLWKLYGIYKETPPELTQLPGAAGSVLWRLYGKNKETSPELTQSPGVAGLCIMETLREK